MTHPARTWLLTCSFTLSLSAFGCGSSDDAKGGEKQTDCDVTVAPSADDVTTLQEALVGLTSGQTLCLEAGSYTLTKELSMAGIPHVTVQGIGASRDDVVLDFKTQTEGDDAFSVQADYFTLQHLTVKDPRGDGVKVTSSLRPTFRDVRAYWSAGSKTENGSYALYPAECDDVLMEDCEVEGSSDACIYLGQSTTGIVRRNKAHGCVIGIEAENSLDVELYDNEAWNNACGMLIVNLPNLTRKDMQRANAHDNYLHENDLANFAPPGAFVEAVPTGTGLLVMAADTTEIHHNRVENNGGPGVTMVSWITLQVLGGFTQNDPDYQPYLLTANVHDNTVSGNGTRLVATYLDLFPGGTAEDILWDGIVPSQTPASVCVKNNGAATFRNINGLLGLDDPTKQSTDVTPFDCTQPALAALPEFDQ